MNKAKMYRSETMKPRMLRFELKLPLTSCVTVPSYLPSLFSSINQEKNVITYTLGLMNIISYSV